MLSDQILAEKRKYNLEINMRLNDNSDQFHLMKRALTEMSSDPVD